MAIEYKTLEQMLEEQGLTMSALTDPGSRFGYGQSGEYGKFYSSFDSEGYSDAMSSLEDLESSLMGQIESGFSTKSSQSRTKQGQNIENIKLGKRQSGFGGRGVEERLLQLTRRSSAEEYEADVRKKESSIRNTEEQIGSQVGRLEGMFTSFLGDAATRSLQIKQGDPTGGSQQKFITQSDIDSFSNSIGTDNQASFLSQASNLLGQPYQSLIDLYSSYSQQQGEPYG